MSYFGGVWSNLAFNAGNATTQFVNSLNWRYQQKTGSLQYVSQSAYKSILVHIAKQLAISTLEGELNSLLPKYQKHVTKEQIKAVRAKQEANRQTLIVNGAKSTEGFGSITVKTEKSSGEGASTGSYTIIAKTKYGTPVPEALILSYEDENPATYQDVDWGTKTDSVTVKEKNTLEKLWNPGQEIEFDINKGTQKEFTTKTVFHIDLAPKVSMNSAKNVILTQVQGRDFTRKELVSGGDLKFNVSGTIVSDQEGVYPTEAVKRFLKIMQYQGIVDVNCFAFGTLGVTRIVIQEFSLDSPEYKNIQPYSFSCVAVEPNDAIKLSGDTISVINDAITQSSWSWDTWYAAILDNKLGQMAANTVVSAATSSTVSTVAASFDELVPNI
jgi:hypothetical protein